MTSHIEPRPRLAPPPRPPRTDNSVVEAEDEPSKPKISWARILLVLVVLGGAALGSTYAVTTATAHAAKVPPTWFAPYVDTTLTPVYQFQDPAADPARQTVLGFVVSSPKSPCTPWWGGAYSLSAADSMLNIGRRIAQLRDDGSAPIVSFGGEANSELALNCTNPAKLAAAYRSVITRYHLTTIDLDIEGYALGDWNSIQRRSAAIAKVQAEHGRHQSPVAVWLTLPVATNGMQDNALSVVRSMLAHHVQIAGVNVMTMDFGQPETDMYGPVKQALLATHRQLGGVFSQYGIRLNSRQVWNRMGATVMIGQNDTAGERFTIGDAIELESFARQNALGRVSLWSINRDSQCGANFAEVGVLSNTCSGVAESSMQFSHIFAKLSGSVSTSPALPAVGPSVVDNPATSPYPIWQPGDPYQTGYKVVREGNVYQAKWYNQGQDPAMQVQYASQTPWLLVGPVLPGDHAPTTTTLAPGTYPTWTPAKVYNTGDRVLFDGMPYEAKWYTQGSSPAAEASNPSGSPWKPLFNIPGEPTTTP